MLTSCSMQLTERYKRLFLSVIAHSIGDKVCMCDFQSVFVFIKVNNSEFDVFCASALTDL